MRAGRDFDVKLVGRGDADSGILVCFSPHHPVQVFFITNLLAVVTQI